MRWLVRQIITKEILVAAHLGAFGDWWAASAARRLRKFSANFPGGEQ